MSETSTTLEASVATDEPSPHQVAEYLIRHPDFLDCNRYLLTALTLRHDTGQSVSLIERQVKALRDENRQLKQQLATLLSNAHQNEQLFEKSRALILTLLTCRDRSSIPTLVEKALVDDFGCCAARLWLFSEDSDNPPAAGLSRFSDRSHAYCGLLRAEEKQLLFAEQAEKVGSAAVLPLGHKEAPLALLAIGNADKNYYRENMSTLLLNHIGEVVRLLLVSPG